MLPKYLATLKLHQSHKLPWLWYFWIVTYFAFTPIDYAFSKSLIELVAGLGLIAFIVQLFRREKLQLHRGDYIAMSVIAFFMAAALIGYYQHVDQESTRKFSRELKTLIIAMALIVTPLAQGVDIKKALAVALYFFVLAGSLVFLYKYYWLGIERPSVGAGAVIPTISVQVVALWLLWTLLPKGRSYSKWMLFIPLLAIATWAIILSETRGAWISYVGLVLLLLFHAVTDLKRCLLGLSLIFAFAAAAYMVPTINHRVDLAASEVKQFVQTEENNMTESSVGLRLLMWKKGLEALRVDPIKARGYKPLNTYLTIDESSYLYGYNSEHLHNELLQQWLQKGIWGLLAIILLLLLPLLAAPISPTMLVLSIGTAMVGLTDVILFQNYPLIFFLVFLAIWLKQVKRETNNRQISPS